MATLLTNVQRRRTRWRPDAPLDLRDLLDHIRLNPGRVVWECHRTTGFKPSGHELLGHRVCEDGSIVGLTRTPVSTEHWRHWRFWIAPAAPGVGARNRLATFTRAE